MTFRHDDLVVEKSQSDARLANAQAEEAAAREERDVACAAADAAEALLAEQIPILQKAHDDCDVAADAEYASCQATADGEINTCTTILTWPPSAGPSSRFRPSTLASATSKLLEPPFCRLLAGSFGMLPRGLPMSRCQSFTPPT